MESRTSAGREPSGSLSVSRWSPKKEQIAILESFYKQGIRTPNTEQIKEITSRLSAYGHIQGKNVFYWFQNHKARQRQKQKQQSIAYSNSFLHASQPIGQTGIIFCFFAVSFNTLYCSVVYLIVCDHAAVHNDIGILWCGG